MGDWWHLVHFFFFKKKGNASPGVVVGLEQKVVHASVAAYGYRKDVSRFAASR